MHEFEIDKIMEFLPHRYPFLMVDRVIESSNGETLSALKNVTFNEPYFAAMKVNAPFVPNHLLMEIVAQIGCISKLAEAAFTGMGLRRSDTKLIEGEEESLLSLEGDNEPLPALEGK